MLCYCLKMGNMNIRTVLVLPLFVAFLLLDRTVGSLVATATAKQQTNKKLQQSETAARHYMQGNAIISGGAGGIGDFGDDYDDAVTMVTPSYQQSQGVVNALVKKIFMSYNKAAQLVQPLVVHMDVLLIKVKSTVEKEGIFESVVALFIEWQDQRMQWDPAQFGNVTHLSLDPDQVGLPDIAMTNSADHLYAITRDHRFNVRVTHEGLLKYVPTGTARTWCDLKLMTFPFDIQRCSLEFESWSLDVSSMTFDGTSVLRLDTSFVSQLWTICQWKAQTYDHTYFTNETFTRVRFDITVKRKSTFYIINLIFPCSTLSLIQMLVFAISSQDTTADRIGFGTTNLLTLVVFQTIVTEEMPKTSDAVTALSKYVIALIITSAIGIFESVIVERMLMRHQSPPPLIIQRLFKPIPVLFHEHPEKDRESDDYQIIKEETSSSFTLESPITIRRSTVVEDWASNTFSTGANNKEDCGSPWQPQHNNQPSLAVNGRTVASPTFENRDRRRSSYQCAVTSRKNTMLMPENVLGQQTNHHHHHNHHYDQRKNMSLSSCCLDCAKRGRESTMALLINDCDKRYSSRSVPYQEYKRKMSAPLRPSYQPLPANIKARNSRLWKELAYKIDCATFTLCATLAIMVPALLFLPLMYLDMQCEGEESQ